MSELLLSVHLARLLLSRTILRRESLFVFSSHNESNVSVSSITPQPFAKFELYAVSLISQNKDMIVRCYGMSNGSEKRIAEEDYRFHCY